MEKIKRFFTDIEYPVLGKSLLEVIWMTLIAFLPIIISIFDKAIEVESFSDTYTKIKPGEMLSFALSFIAPALYLMIKTNDSGYKLPALHLFSIITIITYASASFLYIKAKNNSGNNVDMEVHKMDLYFYLALSFLVSAFLCRIYSVYHGRKSSTYAQTRNNEQDDFTRGFRNNLPKK